MQKLENTERPIKNGQSRETEKSRNMTRVAVNLHLCVCGTAWVQATWYIIDRWYGGSEEVPMSSIHIKIVYNIVYAKVREYRKTNQKWTIQRNWQHRLHKTKKKKFIEISVYQIEY
jgi:hypothetical protein